MVTPDEVVRVKRKVYGVWMAMEGRFDAPEGLGARDAPARPGTVVDGTAASGKGTLAKKLAQHYGFAHLDSGALYRLTAYSVLEAKGDPKNPSSGGVDARTARPSAP